MTKWHSEFLPCWFQYIATVDNIWSLTHSEHLTTAQAIWNCKMSDVPHTLALTDEPAFCLLKQRTYEWRSGMADRAVKAIATFFDRYEEFSSPEVHAGYATWAVPEPEECINQHGRKILVPPQLYPYMWQTVDESNPEDMVCYICWY
ncbi:hypothetical protein SCLCIDRAFT_124796 [Scleroderma citrinum Foug A]|uniref:Uncharacterized protein n=1 Tax=Scleroderma citrinum Foug A TaxID=1036808 RepID=A0A0C3A650_9AGAM|nr:hypothetical protein SCLCIDRAFT_124796 [Scleroderma citrinum Foug A]